MPTNTPAQYYTYRYVVIATEKAATVGFVAGSSSHPGMIPLFVNHNAAGGGAYPQSVIPMQGQQCLPFQACFRKKRTGH